MEYWSYLCWLKKKKKKLTQSHQVLGRIWKNNFSRNICTRNNSIQSKMTYWIIILIILVGAVFVISSFSQACICRMYTVFVKYSKKKYPLNMQFSLFNYLYESEVLKLCYFSFPHLWKPYQTLFRHNYFFFSRLRNSRIIDM